jgi:hypothetical protein
MAGGRPTEYSQEVLDKAEEYLEYYTDHEQVVPSVVGLCKFINRAKSTVYKWSDEDDKAEFSDILSRVSELQELRLINCGLSNQFNPAVTKMMLTKHGYSDKQEVDHTSGGKEIRSGINGFYAEVEESDEA